jgi:hypothetical protein
VIEQICPCRNLADLAAREGKDDPDNRAPVVDIDQETPRRYFLDAVCCGVIPSKLWPAVASRA